MTRISSLLLCALVMGSSMAYSAPPKEPTEKSDKEKVDETIQKGTRDDTFALVKKIGLERIKKKEPLTIKLDIPCDDLLFELLKIRFTGEKPALLEEHWNVRKSKPVAVKTHKVEDFAKVLKRYAKDGWTLQHIE